MNTLSLAGRPDPWILCVDAGSSSVRAWWYDGAGDALPGNPARRPCSWTVTPDGGLTADPEALLNAALGAIDDAMLAGRAAGVRPAAVAMAVFWHGLAGFGAEGEVLTPLYGWGDARASIAAAQIRERVDARAVHQRTGCFVHGLYPAARLVWLGAAPGDTLPRAAVWGSLGELVALRLFGQARTSLSMASGTGLLDLRRGVWDDEMLRVAGIGADQLPALRDEPVRGLRSPFAARWPELAGVPWFPALGDGACASLGTRASGARVGMTVGTSAAVRVLRADADPVVPPGLWCYRVDARRTVCGRALSNGGNGFDWLRRTLALPPADELEARLAEMVPGAHRLTVVPRLVAERPPEPPGPPTASLAGITLATGPLEIVRAWLEAEAFAMADALDAVEAAFGPADEVVAGGGALAASPAWARIVADVFGRPLRLSADPESTMHGAALLALERLGALADASAYVPSSADGERLMPDATAHEIYRNVRSAGASGTGIPGE
ncbi:MAG TPA: FGGY family carbohydrate kinase [Longimicrobium sp.]|uniref:gluconokinase n=1 Tax=Longimicrobium sp. TaxID=2029185 RepID=UPI002ED925AA